MKKTIKYFVLLATLLVIGCKDRVPYKEGLNKSNFNGYETYFYLPTNYQESTKLIYLLHPGESNAEEFYIASNMQKYADETNSIIVAPSQVSGRSGYWTWYNKTNQQGDGEAKMLKEIPSQLEELIGVSFNEKYIIGFSAGACQALNLYVAYNDYFDGVCSVAGLPYGVVNSGAEGKILMAEGEIRETYHYNEEFYKNYNIKNLNILIFHGEKDNTVNVKNSDIIFDQFTSALDFCDDQEINHSYSFSLVENENNTIYTSYTDTNKIEFYKYQNIAHKYGTSTLSWYGDSSADYTKIFIERFIK